MVVRSKSYMEELRKEISILQGKLKLKRLYEPCDKRKGFKNKN